MSKPDDFGGLPQEYFTGMITTFSTPAGIPIADLDKIRILAALAAEEHAAANSRGNVDTIALIMKVSEIRDQLKEFAKPAPSATAINDMVKMLTALEHLWV